MGPDLEKIMLLKFLHVITYNHKNSVHYKYLLWYLFTRMALDLLHGPLSSLHVCSLASGIFCLSIESI